MSFCSRYLLEESLRRSDILRGSAMASCSGLPSKVTSPSVGGHHAGEASFPYVALILPFDRAGTVAAELGGAELGGGGVARVNRHPDQRREDLL